MGGFKHPMMYNEGMRVRLGTSAIDYNSLQTFYNTYNTIQRSYIARSQPGVILDQI